MDYSSEPVLGLDYFLYEVQLPYNIGGATVPNSDGTCTVYINALRSEADKIKAFHHEMVHVKRDHLFQDERSEAEIEYETEELTE